jgi:hypothetical protein
MQGAKTRTAKHFNVPYLLLWPMRHARATRCGSSAFWLKESDDDRQHLKPFFLLLFKTILRQRTREKSPASYAGRVGICAGIPAMKQPVD